MTSVPPTEAATQHGHNDRGFPQPGVTNRPPEHVVLAALRFVERTTSSCRTTLSALGELVRRELHSDLDDPSPATDKDRPSSETGELGFQDGYDRGHLTITLGISSDGMDALGVPSTERPADLRPIPWALLEDTAPTIADSGDLMLQVCSDDIYVAEHVVRRIEEELGTALAVVWTQLGAQRYTSRPGRTSRREGRALIGFLDGTSNLDPRNSLDDANLVFIDPNNINYPANPAPQPGGGGPYGPTGPNFPTDLAPVPTSEPRWTKNGTYMTVRISTFDTTPWDDQTQNAQEQSVGRFKVSGASLDLVDSTDQLDAQPDFATNQGNLAVPVDSHVRKANPRRSPEDAQRRLFRRGYPIISGAAGGMQRGLAFISFARTTSTQFEFIMRAWLRNTDFPEPGKGRDRLLFGTLPETVICGGYYFVPPVRNRRQPWTWLLPDAEAQTSAAA